ncbi:MAG: Hsp20/alpha crystallin family protein [Chloroherpetonaceae bacterium]|nr:Hsp20/alpha crystallin family protein [Chloroherpetonaceae bacterium]MDW8018695.1 Hsp20/alpha crystallin family protein [Chloroherpetonaceae bacterium]
MAQEKSKDPVSTILEGIERLAELAETLQQKAETFSREGEIDLSALKEGMKARYSIALKTVSGGNAARAARFTTKFTSSASVRQQPSNSASVPKTIEPDTDLFVEATAIKIYVQLPGVQEKDIRLVLRGDILELEAKGTRQHFYKEILLPKPVQPSSLEKHLRNGVLEISLWLSV